MSGTVRIGSTRDVAVGRVLRAARRTTSSCVGYLHAVRVRGGLPVVHAVPVAVVLTGVLTWALVAVASAAVSA